MADPLTLGIIGTGISAFSTFQAGRAESANLKFQAKQASLMAKAAEISGKEQQNSIREELLRNLASANAAFAARGISISSGTPAEARIESIRAAEQSIRSAQLGTIVEAEAARNQAEVYRQGARSAMTGAYLGAGSTLFTGTSRSLSLYRTKQENKSW